MGAAALMQHVLSFTTEPFTCTDPKKVETTFTAQTCTAVAAIYLG